jgi:hypothetical protein
MITEELIIGQTKKWITEVVIGCNFCPFAAREIKKDSVHFQVEISGLRTIILEHFLEECRRLIENKNIETSFLILPNGYEEFDSYLEILKMAERLLSRNKYTGIFQLASFHPLYCFAGVSADDAANYTNRSAYPMLQILREKSIDRALLHYADPEKIPERNVEYARLKGIDYMKLLRDTCF